jgi:hypothetical protein
LISKLLAILIAGAFAAPAAAADGVIGTWTSGAGPSAKTCVFKTHDNTFIGTVCGPCDDPSTVFRVADGTVTDAGHVSFSVVGGGPAASTIALPRADGEGALDGDAISFFIHHTDRRNFMKGVITGNVMKFKWLREGRESEPGGEMTLIGPLR